jgi:hypothetical protein
VAASRGLVSAFKGVAHLATALVLLQALLAGFFISGEEPDTEDIHEMVANLLFLVVAAELVLALLLRESVRYNLVVQVGLLLALVVVQIGLGYGASDGENSFPVALHIPLGVLLFGLATLISALTFFSFQEAEKAR